MNCADIAIDSKKQGASMNEAVCMRNSSASTRAISRLEKICRCFFQALENQSINKRLGTLAWATANFLQKD